jgi:hypothetical protein
VTINRTPGMRVHDIELTMPERFDAPNQAPTKPSGDAHIRHYRREPVFVTVITASAMFSAIDSAQMDRRPSAFTTRPSTAMKKLHCRIEPYAREEN